MERFCEHRLESSDYIKNKFFVNSGAAAYQEKRYRYMIIEVFTAVSIEVTASCDVTPRGLVDHHQRLAGIHCLQIQIRRSEDGGSRFLRNVTHYQATQRDVPEKNPFSFA
jgi:hypothetical protein